MEAAGHALGAEIIVALLGVGAGEAFGDEQAAEIGAGAIAADKSGIAVLSRRHAATDRAIAREALVVAEPKLSR